MLFRQRNNVDLVFYNYILKCFVLIDLKTGDLTHQDIGQMYVNYYTREMMNEGDNPPIGLLLCAKKSDTLIQITLPEDNKQIYAAKYMDYMPTEEELKRELNLDEFEKLGMEMMENLKMHTPDLADENFKKLAVMFPNAVTETINENGKIVRAIDADVLRQEISAAVVEGAQERYQFTWPDKKKSVALANQPIAKILRLDREKSVGRDGTPCGIDTEDIYIEGDNLDALKLLQETYLGKVKMIYIDPPYNTGNDWN